MIGKDLRMTDKEFKLIYSVNKDSWHYQLMHNKKTGSYAIHEYYHLDEGDHWTHRPIKVEGDSVRDVTNMLMNMLFDITKHGVKEYNDE